MTTESRHTLGWALGLLFALAMLMGPGPGLLLVNDPDKTLLGLPLVYAWGILWYFVQVFVILTAYFFVWQSEDEEAAAK